MGNLLYLKNKESKMIHLVHIVVVVVAIVNTHKSRLVTKIFFSFFLSLILYDSSRKKIIFFFFQVIFKMALFSYLPVLENAQRGPFIIYLYIWVGGTKNPQLFNVELINLKIKIKLTCFQWFKLDIVINYV